MPEEVSKHHSNANDDPCFLKPVFFRLKGWQTARSASQKGSERKAMVHLNQRFVAGVTGMATLVPFSFPLTGLVIGRQGYNQATTFYCCSPG